MVSAAWRRAFTTGCHLAAPPGLGWLCPGRRASDSRFGQGWISTPLPGRVAATGLRHSRAPFGVLHPAFQQPPTSPLGRRSKNGHVRQTDKLGLPTGDFTRPSAAKRRCKVAAGFQPAVRSIQNQRVLKGRCRRVGRPRRNRGRCRVPFGTHRMSWPNARRRSWQRRGRRWMRLRVESGGRA